ncbi:MAG TPA: hypothetical protein GXX75_11350 [Clostridiales bacterium]|nr:hypothetical protein [Clostridiales bacterium]
MFEKYYQDFDKLLTDVNLNVLLPPISDRAAWEGLPFDLTKIILERAKEYCGYSWPPILASDILDCDRTGSRAPVDDKITARRLALAYLTVAECIENKSRFSDDIANGIWAACDEATWVIPIHNQLYPKTGSSVPRLPDVSDSSIMYIDILGSDSAALFASCYHMAAPLLDSISISIGKRLNKLLDERIIIPFLTHDDYPWMGHGKCRNFINNWLAWIISNVISITLLTNKDKETKSRVFEKCLYYLDKFIAEYPEDGSDKEGTSYWTTSCGSLFDSLNLLRISTGGAFDFTKNERLGKLTSYIYANHIDGNAFVNFADADVYLHTAAQRLYSIANISGNETLKKFSLGMRDVNGTEVFVTSTGYLLHPFLSIRELFEYKEFYKETSQGFPYLKSRFLPDAELMFERQTEGTSAGLYLAVKGGSTVGSHNHLDVGSLIIYSDGKPAIIDMGRGEYGSDAFSPRRAQVVPISSGWHNVPCVNGYGQYLDMFKMKLEDAGVYRAKAVTYDTSGEISELSMDLKDVYLPESGLVFWRRKFRFDRAQEEISITDEFEFTQVVSTGCSETYISLVLANEPELTESGAIIRVNGGKDVLVIYSDNVKPAVDSYDTGKDMRLSKVWGDKVWRLRLIISDTVESDKPYAIEVKIHQV